MLSRDRPRPFNSVTDRQKMKHDKMIKTFSLPGSVVNRPNSTVLIMMTGEISYILYLPNFFVSDQQLCRSGLPT